ncbi:MAG: DUF1501 domain-containing protein [Actinomycetota bacterium]
MTRGWCAFQSRAPSPDRRRLIQAGGIGLVGLSLPDVLQADEARRKKAGSPPAQACIFIVQYGGASHIDSLDLKPDAAEDVRGPYKPISTPVPGMQVCELLPKLAKLAPEYTLIRSMTHGNPSHDEGMHICMTGRSQPRPDSPYFGAVAAKLRPVTRNIPPYVWLQNLAGDVQPRYLTGGFLGAAYAPMRVGTDMENPAAPNFRVAAFDPPQNVAASRVDTRRRLLAAVEPRGSAPLQDASGDGFRRVQERAFDLVTGAEARSAFDLEREPGGIRDRYGRHPLGQNLLMARRLVEAGVRLVSVTAWTGVPPGESFRNVQTWDMHGEGSGLGSSFGTGHWGLGWALPRVDEAVSALLGDLRDRGLLDSTLVVMVGEFGRAPKIAYAGRDHWPFCYSALVAGGGMRGGMVYGASDKSGGYVDSNPVSPEDFGATLYHALGIPPEMRFGPDGFSEQVSAGRPVLELLR